ncbi:(2Fe-2S)-binding protein [Marinobacter sp. M216]|uniref:(2Fe-2S)-binding protein n=1 Tax=Marinobacter albus TaxID=3030833 RepID=A0ABT7HFU6_9GAMM|nr:MULTISPECIES: (2Fe-2S)-binding protein [unclassified Marinobacter]MBW7472692.1 (2Fe-2S)-binding protein [Marinobacter sp. F4218]MDK9559245.1 (2Fe-2S)-binding protein [Marinobacter sp. M216]
MVAADPSGADWPGRYRHLLASAGLNAESVIGQALQPHDLDRPALLSLAQCLERPELLQQQLTKDYPDASNARALRAYLSVTQQDLALSVIAPLTLRLFRDGKSPLPDPQQIFLGRAREGATAARWFHAPSQPAVGLADFIGKLDELVTAWYPVFRQGFGVSPGAYWSSIGLGLGAPFSVVWNLADAEAVCNLAQAWLEEFACGANRFVDWVPAEFSGRQCAIPQRKGCCLKYLLPEGGYCGTCGIYRKARLAETSRRSRSPAPDQRLPAQ